MRVFVILPLCLLAGLIQGSQATAPKPQSSQANQGQEDKSKNPNQGESSKQGVGASHEVAQQKSDGHQQQYDPYSDRAYRAYLWATVGGVFGGIVGVVFLVIQTIASKRAAEAAKESANAAKVSAETAMKSVQAIVNAERPWMFIEITTRALTSQVPGEPPESIAFSVRFTNYGKTPAEIVMFEQHPDCRNSPDDLPTLPKYSLEGHVLAHTRMIAPGKEFEPPGEPSFVPSSFFVAEQ